MTTRRPARNLASILVWSVIAAAFIGPGTVTTAATAGAHHRYALLWALVFSTLACFVLQEAAARLTVVSGFDLGQALREQYSAGLGRLALLTLVLGAIVLGCAAYQAGNILGGVAGAELGTGFSATPLTLLTGAIAALLLYGGAPRTIARSLSVLVAVMGLAFFASAWRLAPPVAELLRGSLVPAFPPGAGLTIIALVGTTVVPYNLFLGSGLARGQALAELRLGLGVSVLLGGVISMAIVVVGAGVTGAFSFDALAGVLAQRLGPWARSLFALGLFAAGLSSAVTAPLAAAVTARSILGKPDAGAWSSRGHSFRGVWIAVLLVGVGFSLAGVKPIPAIVMAQALNGVLLPFVAIFLLMAVNDRRLVGRDGLNRPLANVVLGAVVAATLVLGTTSVVKATVKVLGLGTPDERHLLAGSASLVLLLAWPVARGLNRRRQESPRRVTQ